MTRTLRGGGSSFARLMERHAPHLLRIVTRRLRNPEDAREVIQETQLAVWRALYRYDAGRPFEAWLTSIAVNKCRDWARHRVVELGLRSRLQADADHEGRGIDSRGAESLAIAQERVHQLARALARLPAHLREPLILTAVLELDQSSAARELKVTRKAVEMRIRRARQHLAVALPA
ncbi:MAG: RNA polymerase sigma factor [Steroidobacteraceae bacterium]